MKVCFKCNIEKSLTEFYKHKRMKDGHLNKCTECTKQDVKTHRANNDSVREYDRRRGSRQPPSYQLKYRAEFPEKYMAKTMVNNAVRDGKLSKPQECSECPSSFRLHAHHDDYSKPLSVRWLCARCHARWHAKESK